MTVELQVFVIFLLLLLVAIVVYHLQRIAQNDWVIELKRWNVVAQFRQGRRDSTDEER